MHRTGRGVLGNKAASGTEIIQELGEEHQRTGKWIVYTSADSVFQIAAHEETIPLEELYDGLPDRARDPHRQARGRARDRAAVPRRAGQLRAHAEPARLLARAAAAELPLARPRRRPQGARRRQDRRHLRGLRHRRVALRRSRTSTGSTRRSSCLQRARRRPRLRRTSSRPTSSGATATTRSTSTGACRTSTGVSPDILDALRPGDLLVLTSDHGCDPTTPSTDHSREHALLLAYAEGRNAGGAVHEGEFARRRRDRERVARRQGAPAAGSRERRSSHAVRLDDPDGRPSSSTRREAGLSTPAPLYDVRSTARRARASRSQAVAEVAPRRVLEVGCGTGRARRSASRDELGAESSRSTSRRAWSSSRARAGSTRASATSRSCRSTTARSTASSPRGCSSTCPTSTAASRELARVLRPGGRLVAATNAQRAPRGALGARRASAASAASLSFRSENGAEPWRATSRPSSAATSPGG